MIDLYTIVTKASQILTEYEIEQDFDYEFDYQERLNRKNSKH